MTGFDDNVAVMDEWLPSSPNPRAIFTAMSGQEENSKPVLEIELSLNHGYVKEDCLQSNNLPFGEEKPGLGERIASRAGGFNAPKLNTDNIPSPCLTISSPGLSPATLLESPVFLSNPLAPTSPTTGKFSFFPGGSSYMSPSDPSDKTKDELFDDIDASFTFHPVSRSSSSIIPGNTASVCHVSQQSFPSTEISINYGNCNNSQTVEGVELGSQDVETVNLHGKFPGTSAEIHNSGKDVDPGEVRTLDDAQDEEQRRKGGDLVVAGGAPAEDGYNWRKYGQKLVKGSEYPRSYYKCTHPNCLVTKKVERSREGHVTEIIYKGAHNHPKPPPNRRAAAIGSSGTSLLDLQIDGTEQSEQQQSSMGRDDSPWLVAQQAGTNNENGEETSPDSTTGFESGQMQVHGGTHRYDDDDDDDDGANDEDEDDDHVMHGSEGDETEPKRRKLEEAYAEEMSGATRAIREPRVVVQTTSDVDILDDGYRWRKYGQKVVKGNPNPRSYYKCTGPGCLVRKHVERASHDFKSVITSYDGKHNHDVPMARNSSNHGGSGGSSAQTQVHQPEPRSRFERPVTSNPTFVRPFSFQPRLGPPPPGGFSFACLGQTGLHNLAMPSFPVHPYMAGTSQQAVGEPGLMMLPTRSTDPKVEPVSDTGLVGLSGSSSIYRQFMSRLPQI
ncbi:PREDICTED: probable WRKY transcription factor 2 [Tarenaya hassleriana]|uniref:probable WRKY transcription factor 2 n=1 Tax=Tarenaya hassleriana TaxID=28532 RepID=UPI00053C2DA6|nr:PREDICTED: probable WRKY transcription factor 2 [Tarenaya hassleriana]XP_010539366.1 PREDICTED: probable WRKY transcription factor 2 [Tarenaya hassleriana]XP_010539367.1 PREDICTED: probable WRKY transcription factor 2 [Tarenaya hassleriana]